MRFMIMIEFAITLIQTFTCGISFTLFFAILARLGFLGKLFGMKVRLPITLALEGISIVVMPMIWLIFHPRFSILSFISAILISVISAFVMWYDDANYVYIEEDILE